MKATFNIQHSTPNTRRRSQQGIALVITLIMLSVTLVMAVAFLALAKRERGSVSTATDTTVARLAADTAVANAQAQIVAGIMSGLAPNGVSSNAYNIHLFVSTNYINPRGFVANVSNPTNVNYYYANGNQVSGADFAQNVANLWYLPRAPVMVSAAEPVGRFYLDLNENGIFDPNGWQPVISDNPNFPYYDSNGIPVATYEPPNVRSNFVVGDPEWVGVLEHPDAPHGPNNHFTSRYAFVAVPSGNALDINYAHNQALSPVNPSLGTSDGFMRNQGVGSWEINLAAFLADLNTNVWSPIPLPANSYYAYNEPVGQNFGHAFDDARALLAFRYQSNSLPRVQDLFGAASQLGAFRASGIDEYSRGPLQTSLDYNRLFLAPPVMTLTTYPWSGADSTNHLFTPGDFLDGSKLGFGLNTFTNRLRYGGTTNFPSGLRPTYDRYTFYRMLDQLGSDSSANDGRLNLNYSNAVVTYKQVNGVSLPASVGIVAGAETNMVAWRPLDFFTAASDQMLRLYTSNWWSFDYPAFTNNFAVTAPFSITNIPVWVSNRFVYTPAVHRLLQLAANIYDASTNINNNLPHVFKPIFECANNPNRDVYIVGYTPVTNVTGIYDPQLASPTNVEKLASYGQYQRPIINPYSSSLVNAYGVPWIIGAKKGLPGFNQLSVVTTAQISRRLLLGRTVSGGRINQTNQTYMIGVTNQIGISFWNPYTNSYHSQSGLGVTIYASEMTALNLTNKYYDGVSHSVFTYYNPTYYRFIPAGQNSFWPGSLWGPNYPSANPNSFFATNFTVNYLPQDIYHPYNGQLSAYSPSQMFLASDGVLPLNNAGSLGLATTNYLQAFILDGHNVIDYVQFRDPQGFTNLDLAMQDPSDSSNPLLMWQTIGYGGKPAPLQAVVNQILDAENTTYTTALAGNTYSGQIGQYNGAAEQTFQSFMGTRWLGGNQMQDPYIAARTVYCPYLLQANDPLVHYLASDMSTAAGSLAIWGSNSMTYANANWLRSGEAQNHPLPVAPATPVSGRYQPWGLKGQMAQLGGTVDQNTYNLAYRDPGSWGADFWDFPTKMYPTVGWLGRVHRGTPWQTVYLKSTNILNYALGSSASVNGVTTWANWTGNTTPNRYFQYLYFDAWNSSPQQDFLLFDIFTTRLNDNAVRGTLPVNVGMGEKDNLGQPNGGLAAWSALFSGMVAISNSAPKVVQGSSPIYNSQLYNSQTISPVGVDSVNSPLWQIVNGPYGINATRTNTSWFPNQAFTHVGSILATPALTTYSPFLNLGGTVVKLPSSGAVVGTQETCYGINDEEYEWLPQQMMGLVRATEPRYVLYCRGQTLKPAPGGTVLTTQNFQLVTNYQVVAETVVRAVVRIDGANTSRPHAVVESYNVLPPD